MGMAVAFEISILFAAITSRQAALQNQKRIKAGKYITFYSGLNRGYTDIIIKLY